jgi:hypothetical protein
MKKEMSSAIVRNVKVVLEYGEVTEALLKYAKMTTADNVKFDFNEDGTVGIYGEITVERKSKAKAEE